MATAISAAFGIFVLMGIYIVLPQSKWVCFPSAIFLGIILLIRTRMVESGFRRRPTDDEARLEHKARQGIAGWFGFVAVEECRADSESVRASTDNPTDA